MSGGLPVEWRLLQTPRATADTQKAAGAITTIADSLAGVTSVTASLTGRCCGCRRHRQCVSEQARQLLQLPAPDFQAGNATLTVSNANTLQC